jgi:anti-anti-sigma regulatory factor
LSVSESTVNRCIVIEVIDPEGGALLSLRGRLSIDSAPDLRGRLLATLNRESLPVLTVDLAEVTYLDVAGSATLVE